MVIPKSDNVVNVTNLLQNPTNVYYDPLSQFINNAKPYSFLASQNMRK